MSVAKHILILALALPPLAGAEGWGRKFKVLAEACQSRLLGLRPPVDLELPHLTLRYAAGADREALLATFEDPQVSEFYFGRRHLPEDKKLQFLFIFRAEGYAELSRSEWGRLEATHAVAVDRRSGRLAGLFNLAAYPDSDLVFLGYALRPEYRGQGLSDELLAGLVRLARRRYPGLTPALAILPANRPSLRLAERAGFQYGGNSFYPWPERSSRIYKLPAAAN